MATPKQVAQWATLDPAEQYDAAVEAARKELEVANERWRKDTAHELGNAAEKEASARFDRVALVLRRVGIALLVALGVAVAGFVVWLNMVNDTNVKRDSEVRSEWITSCVTREGGVVYQQAGSGDGAGPLLCVVGGKVVQ